LLESLGILLKCVISFKIAPLTKENDNDKISI